MKLRVASIAGACLAGACATTPPPQLSRIEHIVVVFAENRSFDNLYGLFPGADGIANATPAQYTQVDYDGKPLPHLPPVWKTGTKEPDPAFPQDLPNKPWRIDAAPHNMPMHARHRDLIHKFYPQQEQINGGRNDRFAEVSDAGALTMSYVDGSSLPMWKWAQEYTLADRFFMGAFGDSYLNHFWLICACTPIDPKPPANLVAQLDDRGWLKRRPTSSPSALNGPAEFVGGDFTSDGYSLSTNQPPYQPSRVPPAPGGDARFADPTKAILPPQTQLTIGDTLSEQGVTWAWYSGAWNVALKDGMQAHDAPRKMINTRDAGAPYFVTHHQPFNYFKNYAPGTAARAEHLKDYDDLVADIDRGTLPAVTFYKPQGTLNQHPGYADLESGDKHIADLLARIKASPLWSSTAIIVTYDENGGFWDHVAPPKGDRWGPGTRIPAIIVSPYAKKGYVDHTSYDTTSIAKFITLRFGLRPLPGVRAGAGDLTNAFEMR